MTKTVFGIPTIDMADVLVFAIAYDCWRCPACNGRMIEHACRNQINTFRCVTCSRNVCRAEMAIVDWAEMSGQRWPTSTH